MMQQVVTFRQGPPDVLTLVDVPAPTPGPGEVLVAVTAAGVNYLDILQRSGAYTVALPFAPGVEGSGVVVAIGANVPDFATGDRVAWVGSGGAYATHCVVPAERLMRVPPGVDLTDAAAVLIQGMTAHFLVTDVVPLKGHSTVLVHAGAGGVGGLLTQLAVERGATVIATVSRPDKVSAALDAGAAHVIDYSAGSFAQQALHYTEGRGVDVVYDAVGAAVVDESIRSLRPRGTYVLYGQTGGVVTSIDPRVLNARGSLFFTKPSLSHYDRAAADVLRRADQVLNYVADGRLRPRIHGRYLLDRAGQAHAALESRNTVGKLLLCP
ncbi:quinone oxidoreductase family protein [Dactylosporangium sp. CA-152071]|uniref:quinone oxidoreductase family protein n=1 Tax=Dactylosporangium sp. CA-152071 TaxID=3239933 RepID=UPI003D94B98E